MSKVSTRTNYFPNRYCIQAGWIDLLWQIWCSGSAGSAQPVFQTTNILCLELKCTDRNSLGRTADYLAKACSSHTPCDIVDSAVPNIHLLALSYSGKKTNVRIHLLERHGNDRRCFVVQVVRWVSPCSPRSIIDAPAARSKTVRGTELLWMKWEPESTKFRS